MGSDVELSTTDRENIVKAMGHSNFDYVMFSTDTAHDLSYTFKTIRLMDTKVPIIAVTSYHSKEEFKKLIDLGATSHLVEPLDTNIALLVNTIIKSMTN
jgi:AmiR/NasT family two-component response regulator